MTGQPDETTTGYERVLADLSNLLTTARRLSVRSVNSIMTATYWLIGRQIVELEQDGAERAGYGEHLIDQLSGDLSAKFGRGFGRSNLFQMRAFYQCYQTLADTQRSGRRIVQTASGLSGVSSPEQVSADADQPTTGQPERVEALAAQMTLIEDLASRFPLPWSAYVQLLRLENDAARRFYEAEAIRGGWAVRQLRRQIASQYYERALLSKNKAALLRRETAPAPDTAAALAEVREPYVLEFLDLKDEYAESDLEEALITRLESFLLELGPEFAFVGRQRRLRIGSEWYRVDLLFFHRRLRSLVVIDLKLGKFSHADLGQMHVYLNYARKHWTLPDENPPIGLILCAQKDEALAQYALDNLPNQVIAAEYRMALPDEELLAAELVRTQSLLLEEARARD